MPYQGHAVQIAQANTATPAAPADQAQETHAVQGQSEHEAYKLGDIPEPGLLFANALCVAVLLIAGAAALRRKLVAIPGNAQNFGEYIVESMVNFTRGIIGPGGEKYTPLVGTIFFYILIGNVWGMIPGFHSPTSNLSTTLALGLLVFIYTQYVGIRSNGILGYLKHFAGPIWWVSPLLFPIEVISEIVKPFTLAMRLFGNIFGEDTVVVVLATLGIMALPKLPIVPVQFAILLLGLLTSFVQALVFTLLTCIYISLQSHHEPEHEVSAGHGQPSVEGV